MCSRSDAIPSDISIIACKPVTNILSPGLASPRRLRCVFSARPIAVTLTVSRSLADVVSPPNSGTPNWVERA